MDEKVKADLERANKIFKRLFDLEHVKAIISDCYWYVICHLFKSGQYKDSHEDNLLDRLATNYVSFTLHEEFQGRHNEKKKDNFFKKFYDNIAMAIFYCLYYAYPKSQPKIINDEVKRKILDTCSELFTGTEIKSAKFDHWSIDTPGAVMGLIKPKSSNDDQIPLSFVDIQKINLRSK